MDQGVAWAICSRCYMVTPVAPDGSVLAGYREHVHSDAVELVLDVIREVAGGGGPELDDSGS